MDFLYSTGRKHVDPRYCRTHAIIARLFAESPSSEFNAEAWAYVAQAWGDLADLKEAIAQQQIPELPVVDPVNPPVRSSDDERLSP